MLNRSKGRCQTKRDIKTDAGSSVISSDLKHRANDARGGLSSYSNRRDQSGLNGCCTAMWKQMEKLPHFHFSWIVFFQKKATIYMRDASSGDKTIRRKITPPIGSPGGGSVSRGNVMQALQEVKCSVLLEGSSYDSKMILHQANCYQLAWCIT